MRRIEMLAVVIGLALGCGKPEATDGASAASTGSTAVDARGWVSAVLLDPASKLSGVAIGDLLPDRPGSEIVAVGTDHRMHLIWRDGGTWTSEVIATTPGEMIQVAVGAQDPDLPGDEIGAVGVDIVGMRETKTTSARPAHWCSFNWGLAGGKRRRCSWTRRCCTASVWIAAPSGPPATVARCTT